MKIINYIGTNQCFIDIVQYCINSFDCDYVVGNQPTIVQTLKKTNITKNIIILALDDVFSCRYKKYRGINYINKFINKHTDKKIIFISEMLPIIFTQNNVFNVHYSDLTSNWNMFKILNPVINKNMKSTQIGITFNKNMRIHRLLLLCYIYGRELENYIFTVGSSINKQIKEVNSILAYCDWNFEINNEAIELGNTVKSGFHRFKNEHNTIIPKYSGGKENSQNFDLILRQYYKNSFVEIIPETVFHNEATYKDIKGIILLTEKLLNSIYAYNFPILICGYQAVTYCKEFIGLDMFDDIVNHDYDNHKEPAQRLYHALHDNEHLFTDPEKTKKLWLECKPRFDKNLKIVKEDLYDLYYANAIKTINDIKSLCNQVV